MSKRERERDEEKQERKGKSFEMSMNQTGKTVECTKKRKLGKRLVSCGEYLEKILQFFRLSLIAQQLDQKGNEEEVSKASP